MKPILISQAIESYLVHYRALGRSQSSIRNVETTLRLKLLPWCRSEDIGMLSDLTTERMTAWVAAMMDAAGNSVSSVRTYVTITRTFLKWCVEQGYINESPRVPAPKKHQRLLPEVLSDGEINSLLFHLRLRLGRMANRDHAMILFMLATGVRLSELLTLQVEDLDMKRGTCTVVGKGNKTRTIAWNPSGEAGKIISKHVREMKSGLVFRQSNGKPLTPDAVQAQLKRIGAEVGINLEPHMLRRTWCSQSIAAGMPPQVVTRLGGWSNLDVVEHYLHLATDQQITLAQKFARF